MNGKTQKVLEIDEAREDHAVNSAVDEAQANEDENAPMEEGVAERRAARRSAMDAIGATLEASLQEAVTFRSSIENEWLDDIRQFETGDPDGTGSGASPTKQHTSEEQYRSVTDNITRPATITYAARLSDMLYPTSDRNWDIDCTPKPELPDEVMTEIMAGPDGNGLPEDKIEDAVKIVAKKRSAKMREQIDDQMAECRFNDQGRKVILDACKIGHGVFKGPFAKATRRRKYVAGQGYKAIVDEVMTDPKVVRVDPWNVFPMPCRHIDEAPGVFELHELTAKKVADLRIQPGFSSEQVGRVVAMAPQWSSLTRGHALMRSAGEDKSFVERKDVYPVFEYNGEMPKEALLTFMTQLLIEGKVEEDAMQKILAAVDITNAVHLNCNVWFCQGVVMKVSIMPIDHQHNLYKFFVFEPREGLPFGKGVPALLRDPQRSVRMLWAAIMLNAIMSSAPQIGVQKGALVADGAGNYDMRCTQPRVWIFNGEELDIQKCMQVFTVPSTIQATMAVYETAKKNGEEQVMMPMIAQGEPTAAVPTSSGLAMLMNASNIVQRLIAARYDSDVTTPMIQGFYDWNMEYGEESYKGDYKVIARASSHLLVKDVQAQHFLTALNLYSSNPLLQGRMKIEAWAEEGLRIMDIDVGRFLKTDDEMAAEAAEAGEQQPDPETLKAQAAVKTAEARGLEAETNAAKVQGNLELEREDRALDYEDRIADRESRERIAAMAVQQALAGMDAEQQQRVMEMQAEMAKEAEKNATQTRIAGMRAAGEAAKLAAKAQSDQFEARVEANTTPGPRLA